MRIETAPIAVFQERTVPAGTRLAGWAALVRAFDIAAPFRRPSCVSDQHVARKSAGGRRLDRLRQALLARRDFRDHLGFALRHEDLDLLIFKRLLTRRPGDAFTDMIRAARRAILRAVRGIYTNT